MNNYSTYFKKIHTKQAKIDPKTKYPYNIYTTQPIEDSKVVAPIVNVSVLIFEASQVITSVIGEFQINEPQFDRLNHDKFQFNKLDKENFQVDISDNDKLLEVDEYNHGNGNRFWKNVV
ncbi:14933_t:CDS:1 [Gigaspora margarita]|uniref:14933_t:CDS:1 n=1 Tax=Gigaspora margarita TaxID=4874 RepID=A0ABN7UHZ9_GIGMA|nr:14933_t:CDS:1 [Gigaspora margarita]